MKICPACRKEYDDPVRYCPRDGAGLVPVGAKRAATVALYDALIGEKLEERYRVDARLGEGGLAMVYAGTHLLIDKPVAIKVLKADFTGDDTIVQRFLREARTASQLTHPNIVSITDFGRTGSGAPFFVMERLSGPTLGDLLSDGKALPLAHALAIVEGIGAGLAAAHAVGIVHRDLKPDNVMLVTGPDGGQVVKLVDFGLAQVADAALRLTKAGQVLGTPEYMAPEQAAGRPVDARADLFALGILAYRMLTGRLPFTGKSAVEVLSRLLDADPEPLPSTSVDGVPLGAVAEVLGIALAREPADRPPDVPSFLASLREAASDPSPKGRTPGWEPAAAPAAPREVAGDSLPPRRVAVVAAPGMSVTQENRLAEGLLARRQTRHSKGRRTLLVWLLAVLAILLGVLLAHRLLRASPALAPAAPARSETPLDRLPPVVKQGIERTPGPPIAARPSGVPRRR